MKRIFQSGVPVCVGRFATKGSWSHRFFVAGLRHLAARPKSFGKTAKFNRHVVPLRPVWCGVFIADWRLLLSHTHTHACTHTHARTHTHTQTCPLAACVVRCVYCRLAFVAFTHTHTHTHARTHARTHTHTNMSSCSLCG